MDKTHRVERSLCSITSPWAMDVRSSFKTLFTFIDNRLPNGTQKGNSQTALYFWPTGGLVS
jgi:hypothetical protein